MEKTLGRDGRPLGDTMLVPFKERGDVQVRMVACRCRPSGVGGLVITQPESAGKFDGWALTHEASGMRLTGVQTIAEGRVVAKALAEAGDWTVSASEVMTWPTQDAIKMCLQAWARYGRIIPVTGR